MTIAPEVVQLVPVRRRYLVVGWVSLSTHAPGFLVALPFAPRKVLALVLFGVLALLGACVTFAGNRYALKRVMVPPPPGAVVVPAPFPTLNVLATIGVTVLLVASSVMGRFSASILGIGFGSSFGLFWSAWKVAQFERDDGRRILREVGSWLDGASALYAGP
ncbi:MAG: hypothetical protein M3137_09395 [Actinomycetota bacterium]|nr:hypothetical protein [Actinomycetota bacterium]